MILHIMGSGLRGIRSLTTEEINVVKKCERIFVDSYTSIFPDSFVDDFHNLSGKDFIFLTRENIESFSFLRDKGENIALIVSGDPFMSTTHFSILRECRNLGIEVKIYENASIIGTIPGRTGLSPYRTGTVVSIPKIDQNFIPVSPLKKILENRKNKLHSTILIDLSGGKNLSGHEVRDIFERMMEKSGEYGIMEMPSIIIERAGWPEERACLNRLGDNLNRDLMSPYAIVIPSEPDYNELENMKIVFGEERTKSILGII